MAKNIDLKKLQTRLRLVQQATKTMLRRWRRKQEKRRVFMVFEEELRDKPDGE